MRRRLRRLLCAGLAATLLLIGAAAAPAAGPIKLGFASEETGNGTIAGRQWLLAAQIWAADVNARGGLLGRPAELVYYDDQSNPGLVPGIYAKLINIDHVDLALTQGTNMAAPALPTIIEHRMVAMTGFSLALNDRFHYARFFQTMPYGPDGADALSRGFFEAAKSLSPPAAERGAGRRRYRFRPDGARRRAPAGETNGFYDRL